MSLGCRRKPEYLEKTDAGTGKTCKRHTEGPQREWGIITNKLELYGDIQSYTVSQSGMSCNALDSGKVALYISVVIKSIGNLQVWEFENRKKYYFGEFFVRKIVLIDTVYLYNLQYVVILYDGI